MGYLKGVWRLASACGYSTDFYDFIEHTTLHSHMPTTPLPRPPMIPPFPPGTLRLHACILNRHPIPDPILQHGNPKQPSRLLPFRRRLAQLLPLSCSETVVVDMSQMLAGPVHARGLSLEAALLFQPLVGLVEAPGAVDGPVAEVAVAAT